MERFIFLDVDGVLHPLNEKQLPALVKQEDLFKRVQEEDELGESLKTSDILEGEFMPDIMLRLSKLVKAVSKNGKVAIVLSSTWRESLPRRKAVNSKLKEFGIPQFSSITPILQLQYRCQRAHEIVTWLCANQQQTQSKFRFVILDDSDLVDKEGVNKREKDLAAAFIEPYFVRCEKSIGLTENDCGRAIDILNKTDSIFFPESLLLSIKEIHKQVNENDN